MTVDVGDAMEWLRTLDRGSADALITDPPYSSGGQYRGDRTNRTGAKYGNSDAGGKGAGAIGDLEDFAGDNRDQRSFAFWMVMWLSEARRVVRPGGAIAVFTDWRQLPTVTDAIQAAGFVWRGIAVWDKGNARPMPGRMRADTEFIVWGSHGPMPVPSYDGAPCLPGVFREASPRASNRVHQTSKPVGVMRQLARLAPPGGLIVDPFTGGGSTGVGAVLEGRRFRGCEMLPVYAQIARQRLEAVTEAELREVE